MSHTAVKLTGEDVQHLNYEWASWFNNLMLYSICRRARWKATLEIGIGQYGSGIYLLGLLAKENDARHVAIDIHSGHINRAKLIIKAYDLPVDLLEYDSKAVSWGRRMQLVYVDGGHSTEQVLGDIENFAKWITRNGMIIFDDYGKRHLGVTQAVDRAHVEYQDRFDMMIWPAQGWALWRRK